MTMYLWMVVYVGLEVGGSIGPLPYGEDECLRRAADINAMFDVYKTAGLDADGNPLSERAYETRMGCLIAAERPKVTEGQ